MLSSISMIHPASDDHVVSLIPVMNRADLTELTMLSNGKPIEAVQSALAKSAYSFCGLINDQPVALGGVVLTNPPCVWMVASSEILHKHKKSFLKESQAETSRMHIEFPYLVAYVDKRWRKSVRWMNWLGFVVVDEIEFLKRPAYILELRRDEPCLN